MTTKSTITNAKATRCAVSNAQLFASGDDTRPALTCVALEANAERIRLVSTDSYGLVIQELQVGVIPPMDHDVGRDNWHALVRADDLGLVRALLAGVKEGIVDFERVDEGLAVTVDEREVLLPEFSDVEYPAWQQLTGGESKAARTLKLSSGLVARVGALRLPSVPPGGVRLTWTFGAAKSPMTFGHIDEDADLSWRGLLMPLDGGEMIDLPPID